MNTGLLARTASELNAKCHPEDSAQYRLFDLLITAFALLVAAVSYGWKLKRSFSRLFSKRS